MILSSTILCSLENSQYAYVVAATAVAVPPDTPVTMATSKIIRNFIFCYLLSFFL